MVQTPTSYKLLDAAERLKDAIVLFDATGWPHPGQACHHQQPTIRMMARVQKRSFEWDSLRCSALLISPKLASKIPTNKDGAMANCSVVADAGIEPSFSLWNLATAFRLLNCQIRSTKFALTGPFNRSIQIQIASLNTRPWICRQLFDVLVI